MVHVRTAVSTNIHPYRKGGPAGHNNQRTRIVRPGAPLHPTSSFSPTKCPIECPCGRLLTNTTCSSQCLPLSLSLSLSLANNDAALPLVLKWAEDSRVKKVIDGMETVEGLCKSVHTLALLGFPESDHAGRRGEGLRLLALRDPSEKVDPGARGLHDCACGGGGGGGGIETCTESLGSESCDGGIDAEEAERLDLGMDAECGERKKKRRERRRRRERADFPPPPLRWLRGSEGWGCGFMRAERRDGRLILTPVRIERPDVFRARREGGRLRLHVIETEGEGGEEESGGGGSGEEGFLRCHETRVGGGTAGVSLWNAPFYSC